MTEEKNFHVYIMASEWDGTLYTGVTSDLMKRGSEHKIGIQNGFTKKYSVKSLVYYERHENAESAIVRERQIKKWNRQWKINLIVKDNPMWRDLYEEIYA